MAKKKDLNQTINDALDDWDCKQMIAFLRDIIPLFELYDVEDEDDWVEKEIGGGEENVRSVRLIRTVYLVSRIAEFHTGKLVSFKCKYPGLHKKMHEFVNKLKEDHPEEFLGMIENSP